MKKILYYFGSLLIMTIAGTSILPDSASAVENVKDFKVKCERNNNIYTLKIINNQNREDISVFQFKDEIAGKSPQVFCDSFKTTIQSHIKAENENLVFSTDIVGKKPTLCLQNTEGDCSLLAIRGGQPQFLLQLDEVKDSDLSTSEINDIFNSINVNKNKTTIRLTQRNYESPGLSFNIWNLLR